MCACACVCADAHECVGVYLVIVLATKMLQYMNMVNEFQLKDLSIKTSFKIYSYFVTKQHFVVCCTWQASTNMLFIFTDLPVCFRAI